MLKEGGGIPDIFIYGDFKQSKNRILVTLLTLFATIPLLVTILKIFLHLLLKRLLNYTSLLLLLRKNGKRLLLSNVVTYFVPYWLLFWKIRKLFVE
jgi:hypothetical protein